MTNISQSILLTIYSQIILYKSIVQAAVLHVGFSRWSVTHFPLLYESARGCGYKGILHSSSAPVSTVPSTRVARLSWSEKQ